MVVDDRDSGRKQESMAFTAARSAVDGGESPRSAARSRDHCLRRCVYCRRRDIARHRLNNKTLLYA
jgi:hypothetical protein